MSESSQISFAYSTDGVTFTALGGSATVGRTWFEGIKFGLHTYNLSTAAASGVADFDYFHYTHDGPPPGTLSPWLSLRSAHGEGSCIANGGSS